MEDITSEPVLIAGAGPVGLALAVGLARHGVRAIVFEKKAELSPHSRALLITTRTLEVFRSWGVLERFVEAAGLLSQLSINVVGRGKPEVTFHFSHLAPIATIHGAVILPQNRTEELLLQAAREAGVEVHFEHELTTFSQDATGVSARVKVFGELREFRGSYLVGCDGAHSTVREQLGWPLVGKTYPTRIMLVDVRLPDERGDAPFPLLAPQRRGALAGIRFEPRTWRIISTVELREPDEAALSQASIEAKINRLFGPGLFENVWSSVFRIHCRTSPHFRLGRVILAGDAAHLNSPAGGQGMNAGIHDVHNLAWKLARVLQCGNVEALLTSYEQERREAVVSTVERFTDFLTRIAFTPWAQLRFLLLHLAKWAIGRPAVHDQMIRRFAMLTTSYHHSVLLDRRCLYAGSRAPDCDLENANGSRKPLHVLASTKAVLILFDDRRVPTWNTQELNHALTDVLDLKIIRLLRSNGTPRDPNEWRDVHDTLWKRWRAAGDFVILIRPDHHVGWSQQRPAIKDLVKGVQKALGAV